MNSQKILIGPFSQIVTMVGLAESGPISNDELEVIHDGGIIVAKDVILDVGSFQSLKDIHKGSIKTEEISGSYVLLPGLIDSHTHICYAGSRASDYAARAEGKTYLDISKMGGGIMDTVRKTRAASLHELVDLMTERCDTLVSEGITTCEVKSGYGLTVSDELKMLQAIRTVDENHVIDLIPTALAAHTCPPEFSSPLEYVEHINQELLPEIKKQNLASRADIFIEDGAFNVDEGKLYLDKAKDLGFDITIHADQFSPGGSDLAVKFGATSADHLEASNETGIRLLAENKIAGNVLPGASLGLGMHYAPARKMIDMGMTVAIASDWNPGSAPMGDLLIQAALLGISQKLTIAETLAGITVNGAKVLNLNDRGKIQKGMKADFIIFPCEDYMEILYKQGKLKPINIWKNGVKIK